MSQLAYQVEVSRDGVKSSINLASAPDGFVDDPAGRGDRSASTARGNTVGYYRRLLAARGLETSMEARVDSAPIAQLD
jgi:hypothetical protein